jgi:hypothetical protein
MKNKFECNPTFKKKLVMECTEREIEPDEKNDPDDCTNSSKTESPLSPTSRYTTLDDSSDNCIIFEPHNQISTGNFPESSTSDVQFISKYEHSNSSDEHNDSNDEQNQSSEERVKRVMTSAIHLK